MKGLLIKDIKLMKNQKQFFVVMILMGLLFMFAYSDPFFSVSYLTIMLSMFCITTLSYDEFDNGGAYLFTLPFSRKDYVKEKYLFGFLLMLAGWAAVAALAVAACNIRGIAYELGDLGIVSLVSITLSICFLSLALPIEIKLGVEKGRIGLTIVIAAFFLCFYFLVKMSEDRGADLMGLADRIAALKTPVLLAGVFVLWTAVAGVSMLLSIRFINKKEY